MKTHIYVVFMSIGLLLSSLVSAQTMSVAFEKSWGPGTLIKSTSTSGVLQHVTDGKGEPDFLSAPLRLDGFSGKNIFFDIKIDGMKNFSGFEVRLGDEEFENYYLLDIPYFDDPDFNIIQDKYWHTYSFGLSNATVAGHPEQKITHIGIYIQDNGKGPLKIELTNLRFQSAPARGYVSLTFDDGYIDHLYAAAVMHKYAFPGTAYIMPRQIGEPGYMTLRQVVELKDKYHWGISSHHEIPYTDFSPTELVKEIDYTIDFLALNGFAASAPHLAYPLGRQDRKVVLPAVRKHFETARVAGGGAETLPPADPHLLRTINVMDTTKPEELVAEVNQAVNNGQWAILMFHYFVDKPQSSIEYRKKDFEKFIELLAKANVQVLPVHEVYHKFKTTRTATNRASEN
jgi:peptidoglycan/xylan/chitin deacetylase (PgdA/CDA1 family)